MKIQAAVLFPVLITNQATGIVLGLQSDRLILKAVCTTIFIMALTPMLIIFCAQIRFFVNRKLQKELRLQTKLTMVQQIGITWLNVWQILMYVRLILSCTILVYLYIRISGSDVISTDGFISSEELFTLLFIYLDQPLILGCTLTILAVYYKVHRK